MACIIMWSAHVPYIDILDMYSDHVISITHFLWIVPDHFANNEHLHFYMIYKWRLVSLHNWCATALNKQFPIPSTSYHLNPCLRNLSFYTESEPELHISLADAMLFSFWCRARIWFNTTRKKKNCLPDELYCTVNT